MKYSMSELYIWPETFRNPNNMNEDLLVIRHTNQKQSNKINEFGNAFGKDIIYLQHNTVYTKPSGMIRNEGDVNKIGDFMTHQYCEKYITNKYNK